MAREAFLGVDVGGTGAKAGVYDLTVQEERKRLPEILHMAGLEHRTESRTADLSGGWRQRLALGCALVHRPPLLFLDEPTSGVDPVARREFWDLIYELAEGGTRTRTARPGSASRKTASPSARRPPTSPAASSPK